MHGFVLLARTVYTVRPSLVGTGTVHTYSRVGLVRSTYRSAGTVRSTGRRTAERKEPDRRSISSVPPPFFFKMHSRRRRRRVYLVPYRGKIQDSGWRGILNLAHSSP